jgi:hypothetical protein
LAHLQQALNLAEQLSFNRAFFTSIARKEPAMLGVRAYCLRAVKPWGGRQCCLSHERCLRPLLRVPEQTDDLRCHGNTPRVACASKRSSALHSSGVYTRRSACSMHGGVLSVQAAACGSLACHNASDHVQLHLAVRWQPICDSTVQHFNACQNSFLHMRARLAEDNYSNAFMVTAQDQRVVTATTWITAN